MTDTPSSKIRQWWLRARHGDDRCPAELVVVMKDGREFVEPIRRERGVPLLKDVCDVMFHANREGEEA